MSCKFPNLQMFRNNVLFNFKFSRMRPYLILLIILFQFACKDTPPQKKEEPISSINDSIPAKLEQLDTIKAVAPRTITYDYDTLQWLDLADVEKGIQIDMRYATTNNFVNEQMYECGRCFLRPEVARAVAEAHHHLKKQGYGLKMLDCFRPRPIQQKLWDKVPNPSYVTPPKKGSMHNRGLAVDLTLVDVAGNQIDMGTPFDFFGKEAHHTYTGFSKEILDHRKLLKQTMKLYGFKHIRTEWWHYSYTKGKHELSDYLWECDH